LSQIVEVKFLAEKTTFLFAPRSRLSAAPLSLVARRAFSAGLKKMIAWNRQLIFVELWFNKLIGLHSVMIN